MNRLTIVAIAAVIAVFGLLGGTWFWVLNAAANDPFVDCRGTVVGGGAIGGPFTLTDETGATVTDQQVLAKPSLVYFGYTFCPDVCPLDNARNAEAVDLLDAAGYDVTPVFITIDPERDTAAVLRDFTDGLHPKMMGLTGTPDQIKAVSTAYKTYYKKQDGDPKFYMMDHSTFTYLMLPKIGFVDFFDRDTSAADMARRTQCFVDHMK